MLITSYGHVVNAICGFSESRKDYCQCVPTSVCRYTAVDPHLAICELCPLPVLWQQKYYRCIILLSLILLPSDYNTYCALQHGDHWYLPQTRVEYSDVTAPYVLRKRKKLKIHSNLTRYEPVPDVRIQVRIQIMTSIVRRSILLVKMLVLLKAGTPKANIEKVILLGCTGLQPVISDKCNEVARHRERHKQDDSNDKNDSPHGQSHLSLLSVSLQLTAVNTHTYTRLYFSKYSR